MTYDVTCPVCQARLHIKHDSAEPALICPRCLGNVAHPTAIAAGSATAPASPRSRVATVEADARHASWLGYFIVLAITVLAVLGLALLFARSIGPASETLTTTLFLVLAALVIFLTGLILYPLARLLLRSAGAASHNLGATPGQTAARYFGVILLLVVLFPVALFVIVFTVCTAALVTAG